MDIPESEGTLKFSSVTEADVVPQHWDDDERMGVLFNKFNNRDINPVGYDRKLLYWKNNIDLFCKCNQRCSFTIIQIKKFFVRNGKQPYCLPEVLRHMICNKEVEELNNFMKPVSESYWFLNKSILSSSLSWFKQYTLQTTEEPVVEDDKEFVYIATLERSGASLIQQVRDDLGHDKLYRYSDLSTLTNLPVPTLKIIVQWLLRQKKAFVMYPSNQIPALTETLIKFSLTTDDVSAISTELANIYILKAKEKSSVQDIKDLELQQESIKKEVKIYLKQGSRQLAKSSLRKVKVIENRIQKKVAVLDNIRSLLSSIEEAKYSGEVLSTHQSFLHLFKKYKENMNIDHVENIMDEVVEAIDTQDDIHTIISNPIDIKSPNDADLESELAGLLLEDMPNIPSTPPTGSAKRKIGVDDLPNVPDHSLVSEDLPLKLRKIK